MGSSRGLKSGDSQYKNITLDGGKNYEARKLKAFENEVFIKYWVPRRMK
jgi:hypothetical protein